MDSGLISSQLAFGYISSFALQWLKKQKWFPWVNMDSSQVNRFAAALTAFVVSAGVSWHFDSSAGTLVIAGLTLSNVWSAFIAWVQQFAFQQGAYKMLIKEK